MGRRSVGDAQVREVDRGPRVGDREPGFTLVELLIVVTILPLIVGGLGLALISVFSLQSGVANRLSNTSDLQVASSTFVGDVQSAQEVTTAPANTAAQCGPGTQLVGFEWNQLPGGAYQDVVSYVDSPFGSTNALVRQYCAAGFSSTATTSTTVASNIAAPCSVTPTTGCQAPPVIFPAAAGAGAQSAWVSTQNVAKVEFALAAPSATEVGGAFAYTMAGVPADSASVVATGSPFAPAASAGCFGATPGTGTYASQLCLVDFSSLTGNNMLAAQQGCLEMSVPLPGGSTMYFCIGIAGTPVKPSQLPTWSNAFLGNSCSTSGSSSNCTSGTPFYTGIAGDPALYQSVNGGTTVITLSNISVVNRLGVRATGWQVVGADAESTDGGEWISWTANVPLSQLPDSPASPLGNACGGQLVQSPDQMTMTCTGVPGVGLKTGTAMVVATTPTTFTTSMHGAGLEAMAFGVLLSGVSS